MKRLSFLIPAMLVVGLLLTACGVTGGLVDKVGTAVTVLTEAKVSREAVVLARSSFNVLEVTATNYLDLRRCNGANGPLCRDPAVTVIVIKSVRSGRIARNNLTAFMRSHPNDELGPKGLYDALTAANLTLEQALAAYRANL